MNAQKGLTARKGGANDPSVIQKGLKSGQSAYNPTAAKSAEKVTTAKTNPAGNSAKMADQIAGGKLASPETIATSTGMKPVDMGPEAAKQYVTAPPLKQKSDQWTPNKGPIASNPDNAAKEVGATPPPKSPSGFGRMVPPSESGLGASPPSPTFVGSKRDMRSGYNVTEPLTSKDFAKYPPSSMKEEDDPRMTTHSQGAGEGRRVKQGATPGDGSGTDGSTGPDNARTLSKTTPKSLKESVQVGSNKYRIV